MNIDFVGNRLFAIWDVLDNVEISSWLIMCFGVFYILLIKWVLKNLPENFLKSLFSQSDDSVSVGNTSIMLILIAYLPCLSYAMILDRTPKATLTEVAAVCLVFYGFKKVGDIVSAWKGPKQEEGSDVPKDKTGG